MKHHTRLVSLCAALMLALPATALELVHSEGVVDLQTVPNTIATFDLGVLDTLHSLEVDVIGVPRSNYKGRLAEFKDSTVVGTLFEPDYDVLNELKPELIIAGRRSQPAIPQLQDIAPTVVFLTEPFDFFEGFKRDNLALARVFSKEEQAEQALNDIEDDLQTLHEQNQDKSGAFLFVVKDNVIAHVPGDRFGYAYELAGLRSVLPARDLSIPEAPRPEAGTPEAQVAAQARAAAITSVAQAEPDWFIVLDRGAVNGAEKQQRRR